MTALDPAVRDLLAAIRDLSERHDEWGSYEHAMAFAFAGGVLRSVLVHGVALPHATEVLKAWAPTRALDRAAAQPKEAVP